MNEQWRRAVVLASLRVPMNTNPANALPKSPQKGPTRSPREALPADSEAVARFTDTLKLRSLAPNTQSEYLRYIRKLAARTGRDPALLTEAELRRYIVKLKDESNYSPSTMRTAVAAFSAFYNTHLGHAWLLFSLIRNPDYKTLPHVLTREEVQRLLSCIRLPRFRVLFGLIYGCGLRLNEALTLEVTDIRDKGRYLHLRASETKNNKDRIVPMPSGTATELRAYWKTHRHPRFIFPSLGCGWRDGPTTKATLDQAIKPMQDAAAQNCMKLARAAAGLSENVTTHTLRHSYATHLLEEGVNLRVISAYMGHSSLDVTAIYLHLTKINEGQAREAIEKLQPQLPPIVY
jgi:integrase/recombinase XerD